MIQKFEFKETSLKGAYEIIPFYATDERGGFVKDYNIDLFKQNGIDHELKEVFIPSARKVLFVLLTFSWLSSKQSWFVVSAVMFMM